MTKSFQHRKGEERARESTSIDRVNLNGRIDTIDEMADVQIFGESSIFRLEYRNKDDDAWYTVRVELFEGNGDEETSLIVKFQGFTEVSDVKYTVRQFQSVAEVDEFVKRFRPLSEQFQDRECQKLTQGIRVCAAFSCQDDDLLYFDAVVEAVNQQAHVFTNGEEECTCTFILYWLHGPNLGNLTAAGIANLCRLQTADQVDPDISSFSKLAKQRLGIASSRCCIPSEPHASASRGPASCEESGIASGRAVELQIEVLSPSGKACRYREQSNSDEDLGGNDVVQSDCLHVVLIDNLETDLSPSTIRQFIHEHTSISSEAFIFPSQSSVPYASGAIVLDYEAKLEKIFEFLINPEHIIVSARGRPWIITGKMLWHGTFGSAARILALEYKGEFQKSHMNGKLKVVHSGTEAYKRAKQLRELFMDFVDHLSGIHKRLAFEETKILQSFQ